MSFDALFDDAPPEVSAFVPQSDDAWSDDDDCAAPAAGSSSSSSAVTDDPVGLDEELTRITAIDDFDQRRSAYTNHAQKLLSSDDRVEAVSSLLRQTKSPAVQGTVQNQNWIDIFLDELQQFDSRSGFSNEPAHVNFLTTIIEQYLVGASGRATAKALIFQGRVFARKNEFDLAQASLQRALELEKVLGDTEKGLIFLEMTQIFLHLEQYQTAEAWANKARSKEIRESMNESMSLTFNTSAAHLDFYQRRFIAATQNYYRLDKIESAMIALVLSSLDSKVAEPSMAKARIRMIGKLVADGRAASSPLFNVLFLISKERILRSEEKELFRKHVPAIYLQSLAELGGLSICEQALIEHNIFAVSRVYTNINFNSLAQILEIPPSRIEKVAQRMIIEERLTGIIDQIKETLYFGVTAIPIQKWDNQILTSFALLKSTSDAISNQSSARS